MDEIPLLHQRDGTTTSPWVGVNDLAHYIEQLRTQHGLSGPTLLTLTDVDLKGPSQQIKVLDDSKKLMVCLRRSPANNGYVLRQLAVKEETSVGRLSPPCADHERDCFMYTGDIDDIEADVSPAKMTTEQFKPEYWKLLISYVYMFIASVVTAISLVVVHDRLPDMDRYAPLPDIVLDNIPYVPRAFEMSELAVISLIIIWSMVLFVHEHRFILMRRTFFLAGSMYLLRSITMFVTSLPVPSTHLYTRCKSKGDGGLYTKMQQGLAILQSFGMSVFGVTTCGDYIFSGHAAMLTLLNFFILEYTPTRLCWLRTSTWIINFFGMACILANHDHYTIDVFLSFYIVTRMFIYFHVLANNRALLQDRNRNTRIWFPFFSFFESKVNGIVPNEYDWPLPWPQCIMSLFVKKRK